LAIVEERSRLARSFSGIEDAIDVSLQHAVCINNSEDEVSSLAPDCDNDLRGGAVDGHRSVNVAARRAALDFVVIACDSQEGHGIARRDLVVPLKGGREMTSQAGKQKALSDLVDALADRAALNCG